MRDVPPKVAVPAATPVAPSTSGPVATQTAEANHLPVVDSAAALAPMVTTMTSPLPAAALDAKTAGPPAGVCTGLSPFYNVLAYDARGWCCFEEMVSTVLIMRLQHYGSVGKALGTLPPKLLALCQRVRQVVETPTNHAGPIDVSLPAAAWSC